MAVSPIEERTERLDPRVERLLLLSLEALQAAIPANASVLVVGNQALEEWAPQILQREVINTQFGLEWQPGEYVQYLTIKETLDTDESWDDVLATSKENTLYLLIDREKVLHLSTTQSQFEELTETPHFKLAILSHKGN